MIVRIDHVRCGEHDGTYTFVWAPDDWTMDRVDEAIYAAQRAYLEAVEQAKKEAEPPNDFKWGWQIPWKSNRHRNVGELLDEYEAKKAEYKEWEKRMHKTRVPFSGYLKDQGFKVIGDVAISIDLDWGHRHGTNIDYSETKTDTLPVPKKMASE